MKVWSNTGLGKQFSFAVQMFPIPADASNSQTMSRSSRSRPTGLCPSCAPKPNDPEVVWYDGYAPGSNPKDLIDAKDNGRGC